MFSFLDDCKSTPPPTLEPSGLALSPPPVETPLDPPTLRPMTDPKTMSPPEPLKPSTESPDADSEVDMASRISRLQETPPALSPSEGKLLNGVSNTDSPTRPVLGGVGRRTSILFRKAKNGAKLHRDKDNQLQNGESRTPQHPTPPTTTTTPLTAEAAVPPALTSATQSAGSRSASPEQQQEKSPPRSIEIGITANFSNDSFWLDWVIVEWIKILEQIQQP